VLPPWAVISTVPLLSKQTWSAVIAVNWTLISCLMCKKYYHVALCSPIGAVWHTHVKLRRHTVMRHLPHKTAIDDRNWRLEKFTVIDWPINGAHATRRFLFWTCKLVELTFAVKKYRKSSPKSIPNEDGEGMERNFPLLLLRLQQDWVIRNVRTCSVEQGPPPHFRGPYTYVPNILWGRSCLSVK